MLWRKDKTTAEEVHAITRSGVLADDQVRCCTLARRRRWCARAVVQPMRCAVRDQQDIARCQVLWWATTRIFQYCRTTDYDVIRDLAGQCTILGYEPRCTIRTAQIEMALDRHHAEKAAEPVQGWPHDTRGRQTRIRILEIVRK